MAELVDALASGASVRKNVEVQVLFRPPCKILNLLSIFYLWKIRQRHEGPDSSWLNTRLELVAKPTFCKLMLPTGAPASAGVLTGCGLSEICMSLSFQASTDKSLVANA